MNESGNLLVFRLDARRYALALESVDRVISAVDVTPLPAAPDAVMGLRHVAGQVVPVFDLRLRFRMVQRGVSPADQMILACAEGRRVALPVDAPDGLAGLPPEGWLAPEEVLAGLTHLRGILRCGDGLILIQDLAQFLSADESRALDAALGCAGASGS